MADNTIVGGGDNGPVTLDDANNILLQGVALNPLQQHGPDAFMFL